MIRLLVVPTDVIDLDKCFDLEDDKIEGNENVEVRSVDFAKDANERDDDEDIETAVAG